MKMPLCFAGFYAVVTLVTGTVAGLARPFTSAAMVALVVLAFVAAALLGPRARVGGGLEGALIAWLAGLAVLSAFAVCPERSLHLAVLFASAAAFFYLALDMDGDSISSSMALVSTGAAAFGLGAWLLGYTPRVAAPLGQHHYMAGFLLLHLPLTAKLIRRHPAWGAAVVVQAAAIAGTRSLAGIVALVVLVLWTFRRKAVILAPAVLALAVLAFFVPRTRAMLTTASDPSLSLENRIRYLRTGAAMIKARPWGWGSGSVPLVAARYRQQVPDVMPQGEAFPHLHDLPVQVAAESGVVGLLLVAWIFWRVQSPALWIYALFALADYQLDLPAILFAVVAVAALDAPKRPGAAMSAWLRVALLLAAAAAPIPAICGWDEFERGDYVAAAQRLPDLIPVSAAAGAEVLAAGSAAGAVPHLERAVQLDMWFTPAWFHLGRARLALGDRRRAEEAFSRALLAKPITLYAEGWDAEIYRESVRKAIELLDAMSARVEFDARTKHRHGELRGFLDANRNSPPVGSYRRDFAEITDADLAHNVSLLIFHRLGSPKYTSAITVLLPQPDPYIPPGVGYLRGLRSEDFRLP